MDREGDDPGDCHLQREHGERPLGAQLVFDRAYSGDAGRVEQREYQEGVRRKRGEQGRERGGGLRAQQD